MFNHLTLIFCITEDFCKLAKKIELKTSANYKIVLFTCNFTEFSKLCAFLKITVPI